MPVYVRITKYARVSTTHCACIVLTLNLTPSPANLPIVLLINYADLLLAQGLQQ